MPWTQGQYAPPNNFVQQYDLGQKKIRADLVDENFNDAAGAINSLNSSLNSSIDSLNSLMQNLRNDVQEMLDNFSQYDLCEIYYFLNPALRPGFIEAAGGLITNAATLYPSAFAYLQGAGAALCVTESQWQALSTATYYTGADGTTEGWNGVGGVAKFVIDTAAGTIRVPDLRGMYMEAAGLDSLAVGDVHEDRMRSVSGSLHTVLAVASSPIFADGAFNRPYASLSNVPGGQASNVSQQTFVFENSRVVPTGAYAAPRAFGALACVYLGTKKEL